jgi:predicted nuclease of predicted toxin-antitoxin system
MNFLVDEGVDAPIVNALREKGYDVLYIAELDPGIDDEVILEQARKEKRVLVTLDKDFGELVFRLEKIHAGVILVRLQGLKPTTKTAHFLMALEKIKEEVLGAFVVIQPGAVRIRHREP